VKPEVRAEGIRAVNRCRDVREPGLRVKARLRSSITSGREGRLDQPALQHGSAPQAGSAAQPGSAQQLVQLLAPPLPPRRLKRPRRRGFGQQAGADAQAGAAEQAGSAAAQAGSAAPQAGSAAQVGAPSQHELPRRPQPAAEAESAVTKPIASRTRLVVTKAEKRVMSKLLGEVRTESASGERLIRLLEPGEPVAGLQHAAP
jgi:hypothetical protein